MSSRTLFELNSTRMQHILAFFMRSIVNRYEQGLMALTAVSCLKFSCLSKYIYCCAKKKTRY